ncbi:universal stress protein [Nocardiopsis dassonvillei]|uniref:UspA domain protein n=1 Tax=Nocardiopsis dassonvillei (strain ATCC 23218 / DSM 43111 / CIP 107115 / JCM 7437 / KCTC 9190 / NBRC 14626 / NCTC 10488 / NRRL B-5397 / IMRU 509) TaxID=446468 RepID=D7B1G1_NOCDD|nr:universal stress protein [Nocardiopsis dassonvillei]ADH66552.1 UspA domain protein [Nocardiopsis dassonvillei subsp. dassonvillei DSM 43111]APC34869.1 universal stress protein UspA [Nocardiopsis dassonvillei]NKY80981.1 universal stress protein [Nocardiopsis dassonvillei]VEI92574.1 Universal stress protein MSMEG_3950 [Nocardiopsis dassonvillei]
MGTTDEEGVRAHRGTEGIVVGVDGSPGSRAALDWAARAAADRGLELLVLHALSMPVISAPLGFTGRVPPTPELADWAERLLREAVDHVARTRPGLELRTEVSKLDPARALLTASRSAEMAVVGSRGLGGTASVFLGSVSVRVSAHATCPVAVVPGPDEAVGGGDPRVRGERGRVVVGLDGSAGGRAALRFALDEAARTGAELVAVHAWEIPNPVDVTALDPAAHAAVREYLVSRADEHVRALVEEARTERTGDVPVRVEVVQDQAAHALLTRGDDADLIVVGSRGRGGFAGLLLGSVSQTVLHHARVPVVVARSRSGRSGD